MIRLALLLSLFGMTLFAADLPSEFDAANRLYEKGDYTGAAAAYQKLAQGPGASSALLFNLGNAWFKSGQVGRAIVAYRSAARLAPRDPDVLANLRFAMGSVPGNTIRLKPVERALRLLTLNELGALSALSLWLFFGSLAAAQLRPAWKGSLRTFTITSGVLAFGFTAWFGESLWSQKNDRRAVVIQSAARAHFGPFSESQVSFNVRDGNVLKVIGEKGPWLQVADPTGRTGWMPSADVLPSP